MIAADSSSIVAYISGEHGSDVTAVAWAIEQKLLALPPAAFSELLSDPKLPDNILKILDQIPLLSIDENYWERAGRLRAKMIEKRCKPGLSDTFIAQSCLDHGTPLITRDEDFQIFRRLAGLILFQH
ncbi:PIN domain-containing protein [bacterium]|nr:MAG: PIN domain-containing protein [bacterium]